MSSITSSPPTGTVTFLFTDIEGSTKLAQAHPHEWESARERHHSLLREAVTAHQGYVFHIIGDAFCVAFATAVDALAASVDAQRTLQTEAWGETPIRVRMGLHTGTAEFRDGDYQGYLTLAHVQRVMSMAYGGQTLVSNGTAGLLAGQLPDGVTLRDLGEHRLEGLLNPEHLWQMAASDLPQHFPPLQSLNSVPNNLPIQVTSFVGRERELRELQSLLTTTRLLTLTGSGGTGKTRLSLQVATEVLDSFKGGVWFVELAPLADPALVSGTIASVLGVREEPGRPLSATLLDWLRPKQLLIVLDNCEHLIEACAKLADAVLHSSRETRVLASSREALGIAGELSYAVPPLQLPTLHLQLSTSELMQCEAPRLFVERATQSRPSFSVTDVNVPFIAQICNRLDGIPLALELAAARVKVLSVEQIAARLDDRFRLLSAGNRTALPRHQTLRAAIDWSYDLLSELESILLRRLSVFASGWTLEAAADVCLEADTLAALDPLSQLVTKSLVLAEEFEGTARYHMLETMRQYAHGKLVECGELEDVRNRHLQFYLKLAEDAEPFLLGNAQQIAWLNRLEREHDNLRQALDWSCAAEGRVEFGLRLTGAVFWFWIARTHLREGLGWLEQLLKRSGGAPEAVRAKALLGVSWISQFLGDYATARTSGAESLALFRALDDKDRMIDALTNLGLVALDEGHHNLSRSLHEEGLALGRQIDNKGHILWSLYHLGKVALQQGDNIRARALYAESLVLARTTGDQWAMTQVLVGLGLISLAFGDYTTARALGEEGLQIARELGMRDVAQALTMLGEVALFQSDFARAKALFEEGIAAVGASGERYEMSRLLRRLAQTMKFQGQYGEATALHEQSLTLNLEIGSQLGVVAGLAGLASVVMARGHTAHAARLFGAVEGLLESFSARLPPYDQEEYDRDVATLRARLVEPTLSAAWAEGRALTPGQAIAAAEQMSTFVAIDSPLPSPQLQYSGGLTTREVEVLRLVVQGLTDSQIADTLTVSTRTINSHLRSIYSKLDVRTRMAAAHIAVEHKMV